MPSAVARRPALLVVLPFGTALGLLAAMVWCAARPVESTAVATVFLSRQGVELVTDVQRESDLDAQLRNSSASVATSPIVLQPVIERLGLHTTVRSLARHVSIGLPSNTALMEIEAEDPDPRLAQAISNEVARGLARSAVELQPAAAGSVPLHVNVVEPARAQTSSPLPILAAGAGGGAALAAAALLARSIWRRRPPAAGGLAAPSML